MYFGLVHSNLSYCPGVWAGQSNVKKLQIMQNKALRCVFNLPSRFSRVELYTHHQILPVIALHKYQLLTTIYNIVSNIGHITITSIRPHNHAHNTRHRLDLETAISGTRMTNQRVSMTGALWFNSLPSDVKNSDNAVIFKARLKSHLLEPDELTILLR